MVKTILSLAFAVCSLPASCQTITAAELPEYVIVTAENTKIIGGIGITIDSKKSPYKDQFEKLEVYLQSKSEKQVRTLSDLLNVMYELGFEYVNAFNATSGELGVGGDVTKDLNIFGSEAKFRNNVVFKKKKQ